MDFSVVICTFNGSKKLPTLLASLAAQAEVSNLDWEILVVDNNSNDNTSSVVESIIQGWNQKSPVRYLFEPKQGLAFARRCAVAKAQSPVIGFLDDDTIPDQHWVLEAVKFARQHPRAGAFGSEINPIFESPPPEGFERIAPLFAIVKRGDSPFIYAPQPGILPAGAGMVIRQAAWLAQVPETPIVTGVSGTSLSSKGEDVETLSYIRDGGWEVWHNPSLKISHYLPTERLKPDYMVGLCRAVGRNRFPLRMARYNLWQKFLLLPAYMLSDLRKLVFYKSKNLNRVRHDAIAKCELALLESTLMGPINHWFRGN